MEELVRDSEYVRDTFTMFIKLLVYGATASESLGYAIVSSSRTRCTHLGLIRFLQVFSSSHSTLFVVFVCQGLIPCSLTCNGRWKRNPSEGANGEKYSYHPLEKLTSKLLSGDVSLNA